jgi:hypothetical protein
MMYHFFIVGYDTYSFEPGILGQLYLLYVGDKPVIVVTHYLKRFFESYHHVRFGQVIMRRFINGRRALASWTTDYRPIGGSGLSAVQ